MAAPLEFSSKGNVENAFVRAKAHSLFSRVFAYTKRHRHMFTPVSTWKSVTSTRKRASDFSQNIPYDARNDYDIISHMNCRICTRQSKLTSIFLYRINTTEYKINVIFKIRSKRWILIFRLSPLELYNK